MKKVGTRCKRGFIFIELMVVVTIIAVLAALIVPALQKAQAKAMAMKCISKARSIAAGIRSYASNWGGWTNSDPHHYVSYSGYRLRTQTGYINNEPGYVNAGNPGWAGDTTSQSYQAAQRFDSFTCPVDEAPGTTRHAVRTSYQVSSFFAGDNVANLTSMPANQLLAVRESGGKRHPRDSAMESTYVFADLSSTLGYDGPIFPGYKVNVYNTSDFTGIAGTPEASLDLGVYSEVRSGDLYFSWNFFKVLIGNGVSDWDGYTGDHNWNGNHVDNVRNVVTRADGLLKFPFPGNWRVAGRKWHWGTAGYVSMKLSTAHGKPADVAGETSFQTSQCGPSNSWYGSAISVTVTDTTVNDYWKFQFTGGGGGFYCDKGNASHPGWYMGRWGCTDASGAWNLGYGTSTDTNNWPTIPGTAIFMMP